MPRPASMARHTDSKLRTCTRSAMGFTCCAACAVIRRVRVLLPSSPTRSRSSKSAKATSLPSSGSSAGITADSRSVR